ncbi:MAG: phosphate ABC transporter ATP-binding protein [Planctomycetota bacterium]
MIQVQSLSLQYPKKTAFQNISLTIQQGQVLAVVGPSGCGKTSFLYCLNRLIDLIPRCKVTGHIFLEGQDIYGPGINLIALRKRIGMIFQKPNPFPVSIRKNLELPLRTHGVRRQNELDERIEVALKSVGLFEEVKDRLQASAMTLSGGQQQRLCLARALSLKPEIILLDEPCSSLDPLSSAVVEEFILKLKRQYTIILVTHNLAQAKRMADSVALFWYQNGAGYLLEVGACEQIFENPQQEITASYIRGTQG